MSKAIRNVLVVNAGSSSLKFMLFNMENETLLAKGQVERIAIGNSLFTYKNDSFSENKSVCEAPNHTAAVKLVCDALTDPAKGGVLKDLSEIDAVGHRIVHGGEIFSKPAILDAQAVEDIEALSPLAPLHNPGAVQGIRACEAAFPKADHVAVFDTAFHQTMPAESYLYSVPEELHTKYGVRRYGFHGTSHHFVTNRIAELLGKPVNQVTVITCHLGNGSSISAIKNGKCFDTSMGMTPLAGVMMGTRSGDIDPAVYPYLMKKGYTAEQIDTILNKQSGVLALSGTGSSDMRDLCTARDNGDPKATLAMDRLIHSYLMYIGGYLALLGKVDAIVLTGGVGENSFETREALLSRMEGMGVTFDRELNKEMRFGKEGLLSLSDSSLPIYVVPTNEELMIARETFGILSK